MKKWCVLLTVCALVTTFGFIQGTGEAARHHVALAAIPHDVYLYYTYRSSVSSDAMPGTPDWNWRPIADLRLPNAITQALAAPTG